MSVLLNLRFRHCEERSDEAIQFTPAAGLLRFARNDSQLPEGL